MKHLFEVFTQPPILILKRSQYQYSYERKGMLRSKELFYKFLLNNIFLFEFIFGSLNLLITHNTGLVIFNGKAKCS